MTFKDILKIDDSLLKILHECADSPICKIVAPIYSGIGCILMLHKVFCEKTLEEIINYFLNRSYEFISLDEVYYRLKHPKKQRQKFVCFTFDDGYHDILLHAYPVLKKYNIPFCIYVSPEYANQHGILWWEVLDELLKTESIIKLCIDDKIYNINNNSGASKNSIHKQVNKLLLEKIDFKDINLSLENVFQYYNIDLYKHALTQLLSWEDIKKLNSDPLITIGAHTVHHIPLNKLPIDAAKSEILESKNIIESYLNIKVEHFCYPFGEAGIREFRMVREMDFKTATTCRYANIFPQHIYDLCSMPRIPISNQIWGNVDFLNLYVDGLLPAFMNKLKRCVNN